MNPGERDRELSLAILEHCQRIEDACNRFGDDYETFVFDEDYQDVINMNILQIGELANQLTDAFKEQYPDVPWHQMYGIRNIMAHAYIQVDAATVWDTVKNDIPKLKMLLGGS